MEIPEAQRVLEDLAPLWPRISAAMEFGANKVQEFFDRENGEANERKIDSSLAPNLVRWHAKEYLRKLGERVEGEDVHFDLHKIPNNGLYLTSGRYRLRILKADDGEAPAPGTSTAKQQFYQQTCLAFTADDGVEVLFGSVNLLVLWEVTYPYNLTQLSLACPKNGKEKKASVELHWEVPIPFAGLVSTLDVTCEPQEDDLPIMLNQPVAETGETE